MNLREVPLIFFTVLSQAAVGLILVSDVMFATHPGVRHLYTLTVPSSALILLCISVAVSMFHLGHPMKSHRSLANLKHAWLSREIFLFSLFGLALVIQIVIEKPSEFSPVFGTLSAVTGVMAVYTSARVYDNKGFPALNSPAPLLFFFCTTLLTGAALIGCFFPLALFSPIKTILLYTLMMTGIVHVLAPCFWLLGARASRASARAHFDSWLFRTRIAGIFCLWMVLFLFVQQISILVTGFIFVIELTGRWLFFHHMAHASRFIGKEWK